MLKELTDQTKAILYLDPDPEFTRLYVPILRTLHLVYPTDTIESALAMIRAKAIKFDAIVTAGRVSGIEGQDIISMVKKIDPGIAGIIFTNHRIKVVEADIQVVEKIETDIGLNKALGNVPSRANLTR